MANFVVPFFWKDLFERAGKTALQAFLASSGLGAIGVFHLPWEHIGEITLTAFVLSIITSLLSSGVGPTNPPAGPTASLVNNFPPKNPSVPPNPGTFA